MRLTGVPPYPEGTVLQKLLDHQGKEAPDPALKNRHVPPDLSAICRKMMASDPKQRYATPEQLVRDLMPLAARLGLRGLPADGLIWRHITPPKQSFWERNLGWVASVSVLLLIVFVIWRFPSLGSPSTTASLDESVGGRRTNLQLSQSPAGDSETKAAGAPANLSVPVPPPLKIGSQSQSPEEPIDPLSISPDDHPRGKSEKHHRSHETAVRHEIGLERAGRGSGRWLRDRFQHGTSRSDGQNPGGE